MRMLSPFLTTVLVAGAAGQAPDAAAARLKREVAYLASADFKGRGNGSPELDQVADHLVGQYRKLGLQATVQRFPFVAKVTRTQAAAKLGFGDSSQAPLIWGRDIEALGWSADGKFPAKALIFAGYGLATHGRDDLAGLDLRGKVAMILRRIPTQAPFDQLGAGERNLVTRLQRLAQAGVAAVMVLEDGETPAPLQREEGPLRLEIPVVSAPVAVPARVCPDLADRVARLKNSGEVQSKDYVTAPWSTLELSLALGREEVQLPNVAVTLPGTDPKLRQEHLVVGAHFDHLGLGGRHSLGGAAATGQPHLGADDNASGTALVLELARQLRNHPPKRSVTFLHFSGEEEGLLGSAHWVRNPTVPLAQVKVMLNFDMVGRLDPAKPTLALGGLGAPKPTLEAMKALAPQGLAFTKEMGAEAGGSDHMSFAAAKIPTFFFFTGLHTDYHRPSDTADKINAEGMATLATFAATMTRSLGDAVATPLFDPATAVIQRGTGSPMRVSFGTLPDYGEHKDGFRINGTSPGSTAEAIGLKAGDVITAFGERPVKNIYDFMGVLGAVKPGDEVVVKWLRDGRPMEAKATLKARQ